MTGFVIGSLERPEEVYKVGSAVVRLLLAFGDLIIGWLLARQAEVAGRALDNADALAEADRDFYAGKLAVARFFATTVAAPPGERPQDHRGDHQRPHGRPGGRVLGR